ncbi:MAG: hypothetical protein B5766_12420 [Candidatus Lumbricidophila eiseniae]|uniref:Uncharacterized protein n=1 Tax=Candidatus Lumbricidiphila eiseniae TaxID=1969409 RepID=A0A2A6FNR3_9MICO|nr:MAG: hypothetical protein B5766_12420 [Candidatus Lumbricidophila eiseniae]
MFESVEEFLRDTRVFGGLHSRSFEDIFGTEIRFWFSRSKTRYSHPPPTEHLGIRSSRLKIGHDLSVNNVPQED